MCRREREGERQAGRLPWPAGRTREILKWLLDAFMCGCEGEFQRFRLVTDPPRSPGLPSPLRQRVVVVFNGATTLGRFLGASAYPANYLARCSLSSVSEGWLAQRERAGGSRAVGALESH